MPKNFKNNKKNPQVFSWKKIKAANGYIVQYQESDAEDDIWSEIIVGETWRTTYRFTELQDLVSYNVRVLAYNEVGRSQPTDVLTYYIGQKKPKIR